MKDISSKETCKEIGVEREQMIPKLIDKFHVSQNAAEEAIIKYWG